MHWSPSSSLVVWSTLYTLTWSIFIVEIKSFHMTLMPGFFFSQWFFFQNIQWPFESWLWTLLIKIMTCYDTGKWTFASLSFYGGGHLPLHHFTEVDICPYIILRRPIETENDSVQLYFKEITIVFIKSLILR